MYHSHSLQDNAFNYFASFLENAIIGSKPYENLVKPIIEEAHLLATGERNYYTISRDNFQVITFLVEREHPFFANLNMENITTTDYSYILDLVTAQRDIAYA